MPKKTKLNGSVYAAAQKNKRRSAETKPTPPMEKLTPPVEKFSHPPMEKFTPPVEKFSARFASRGIVRA